MKFHLNVAAGNMFTGHGEGFVRIGETDYRDNLLVTPDRLIDGWAPGGFDTLSETDFAALAALKPEVALFGSGTTMRFPDSRLTRALTEAGIGLEIMDTPAACRTYNILAAEGRRVAAAILISR